MTHTTTVVHGYVVCKNEIPPDDAISQLTHDLSADLRVPKCRRGGMRE